MKSKGVVDQVLDGKYQIENLLGKGGMGSVYLATHIGTGRPVAVKVIAPEFMQRAEFVERFRREAKAAGRLRHPNVVDVTDFGFARTENDEDVAYLVMEYLDGCTLGEVLDEEKQLPVGFSIDILEQVCSAVEEAHNQGIIHRDLKPDNIWLEPNQRGGYTVKVLDFGIAKLEEAAFADIGDAGSSYISSGSETRINPKQQTFADDDNAATIADQKDTVISENKTVSLESNTLGSEAGTMIQETGTDEKPSVDSDGGTVLLPSGKTRLIKPEENKATQVFAKGLDTDEPPKDGIDTANLTRVGAVMGTPLYMSPEQCRGEKLSRQSDIYSLAVIIYQMLSGKLPFEGDYLKVMEGHKNSEPPPLVAKKAPKKLKGIVMQALSKDAEDRPETADAFANKVRSNSEGLGTLLRKATVIYSERLPTFLSLAFLVFLPLIALTFARVGFGFLFGFGVIENTSLATGINVGFAIVSFFAQIVTAALLVGMTTWIVGQTLAYPLKPIRIRAAFSELKKRWKALAGTVTVSTLISLIGLAFCFLPGIWFSARYMLIAPSIMMENISGRAAFRRSVELTKRSFRTVFATALLVYIVPGVLAIAIGLSIASIIKNFEMRSEMAQMKKEGVTAMTDEELKNEGNTSVSINRKGVIVEKNRKKDEKKSMTRQLTTSLQEGIFELVWTPLALLITSFTAVVTSLIYFKTRQAGGESMQELLGKLDETDKPQSKWQQRVRERLIQSGKITGNTTRNTRNDS